VEGKATLLQEVLDVLQLGVVVVFIFGFLLEGTVELSSTTVDVGSLGESSLAASHDRCLSAHALQVLGLASAEASE
jgi:hypothetical protein